MAISWDVDELRSTVQAQMAEANQLDEVIDELTARAEAAETEVSIQREAAIHYQEKWLAAEADAARLRAELAEANAEITAAQNETIWLRDALDGACALAEAERAQAEVARLRAELEVTRNLLRDAPVPLDDDVHQPWYVAVCDYLETLDNSSQDAAGG